MLPPSIHRVCLASLELADFRNITRLSYAPQARFNVIVGANGMGKTNVLEAIYLLSALRSFRTTTRRELIRHDVEEARIRGTFGGESAGLACDITLAERSRRIRVNGKAVSLSGDHFRSLPMVLFHPSNMVLVQGGPDGRRRLLDRAIFQVEPAYPRLYRDYAKLLTTRNRLLKEVPVDLQLLSPYTLQLAQIGTQIVSARRQFITVLGPLFERALASVSDGLRGVLSYCPSADGSADEMVAALEARRGVDLARRFTTMGPHADDLEITLENRSARRFASQGQQRAIVLALKIAKTRALAQLTEKMPVLLLDDISSELDRRRNRLLFEFLADEGGQVFITTTHLDHILLERDRLDMEMRNGILAPL